MKNNDFSLLPAQTKFVPEVSVKRIEQMLCFNDWRKLQVDYL